MENLLMPAVGSNQHVTRFDEKAKRKTKFKIKFATKVKVVAGLVLIASLVFNWYLLKTNYQITCNIVVDGIVQAQAGHFLNNTKCLSLNQDWIEARNYEASQRNLTSNQ